jgi:dynein heavy chain, axonemal
VRSWQLCELPTDDLSTENGIVMAKSSRWPLLIDPQGQANRFIKNMAKSIMNENFDVIKESDSNFLRTLENGVRYGKWIILENIGESLDATLEPILLRRTFRQGSQLMMRIGDNNVPYNDTFRFFLTTKLANPHYPPEVCVKVTLLNFAITPTGLEEQLLNTLILEELPEVAAKKNALVVSNARMTKELHDIENKILQLLSEAEGNILDNVDIINALDEAKETGNDIKLKMLDAVKTEKEIDLQRKNYRPVAYRATTLFFCITDLARVDPMYQYSLLWFTQLFILAIKESEPSSELNQRLINLNESFTYILYENVCRSLFEKHKLLFSFMLCIKILQSHNEIDNNEWYVQIIFLCIVNLCFNFYFHPPHLIRRFLISGYTANTNDVSEDVTNPAPSWLTEKSWSELLSLTMLSSFNGLCTHIRQNVNKWKQMFDGPSPQTDDLPDEWNNLISFRKLLILRCLRPDKVTEAMQIFITEKLSNKFIEPPPFDLPLSFKPSNVRTPLIFVLSAGSDPMKDVLQFADSMKMSKRFNAISLGQGQGPRATKMVETGMQKGEWVLLQNCHLMTSWMNNLEKIVEDIDPTKVSSSSNTSSVFLIFSLAKIFENYFY